ncbi:hypothetical protein [uncultured Aquimarina sp.]|uniref:hypothetical protein n=1 Tax=uncultured Aquimarina sp. TaxID=575652 RepID=UPI00263654A7|nr:hypothetical protein [uncultured Aquimarina sp.]
MIESTGSKQDVLLQKELPFGEQVLKQHLGLLYNQKDTDSPCISRPEFLKLLEINVNKE